ncbi:hypothetical protein [Pseudonocardia nigra]|uniref:hypothetical protein n=1 Tax=Pseudonocardia nigra TaxID=1921578 RepID=UPI001C5FE376|nr:hypothetical protein [Pseudonocardia nigra]
MLDTFKPRLLGQSALAMQRDEAAATLVRAAHGFGEVTGTVRSAVVEPGAAH